MIRITRSAEHDVCPQLEKVREAELRRVRPAIAGGAQPNEALLGREYKSARAALARTQHYKCCYCEQRQPSDKWKHVEHFRPKSVYWWLTWSWDNLLFACEQCNSAKLAYFPLAAGSTPLEPEDRPPGGEHALLLHPAEDDPRAHIEFSPAGDFWFPHPRGGSARGREMLGALSWTDESFAKPGLLESWRLRVADLRDCISTIEAAMETNDPTHIRRVWERQTFRFRVARAEFVGLSLDVLDRSFPAHVRRRWSLCLDVIHQW